VAVICAQELTEVMQRPSAKLSVLICCLFPSRTLQRILLYFETVNRCEVILKMHFDSV